MEAQTHDDELAIPEGMALTPMDPAFRDDPAPILDRLRERAPVHRDRQIGGVVVSRYRDVQRVLRDPEFWADPRKAREGDPVRMFVPQFGEPSMLLLDDPAHKRLRGLVAKAFTPRAIQGAEPLVRDAANALVAALEVDADGEFDLMQSLAAPLPAIAIATLLGVDASQHADFKAWSEAASNAFFDPFAGEEVKAAGLAAGMSLDAVFQREIAHRREVPSDDFIGILVRAEEQGDKLSGEEVVTMCNLLLIAGNVTTTDLIGNGVKALLEHPDELAKLRGRPDLMPRAVEEMLRFDPPVTVSGRIAPRDVEIGGVVVQRGESISTLLAAANRDPEVYTDPHRFDIERDEAPHQSFGGGAHLCLGAHLARLEAREAIQALLDRFPRLQPAGAATYKQVPGFRGLAAYRVRVG